MSTSQCKKTNAPRAWFCVDAATFFHGEVSEKLFNLAFIHLKRMTLSVKKYVTLVEMPSWAVEMPSWAVEMPSWAVETPSWAVEVPS
jgi:hypothetical protein